MPAGSSFGTMRELSNGKYQNLYDFKGGHRDGRGPNGDLLTLKGVLYGTTFSGGNGVLGDGTVFSLTTSGVEHVLYKFKGGTDGFSPNGGLVAIDGVLYGTTNAGGIHCGTRAPSPGCGTVFSVTASGKEKVLYRFKGRTDGIAPVGGLVVLDGKLYGVTSMGGVTRRCPQSSYGKGCGTVFSVDVAGHERVLYRFRGDRDGALPGSGLLAIDGKLYGTTYWGGDAACRYYCGTLFEIETSGVEKVLYRFQGGSDGSVPASELLYLGGVLYGSTTSGGNACNCGTVFKATLSGKESVLYRFNGPPDAQAPSGRLVPDGNWLYGIASGGNACFYYDAGTIFSVTTAGKERVSYDFPCGDQPSAGNLPAPGLTRLGAVLYGTTSGGGYLSRGTAFGFTP
jgi:uncharacterized repeat protein (TIGR03803 family)